MTIIALLAFFTPSIAHAYIDPGTGNAFAYVLFSLLGAGAHFLKSQFYRISGKGSGKASHFRDQPVAIFSEGKRYGDTFEPIVDALIHRQVNFSYLTCDIDDPILTRDHPLLDSKYIGEGSQAFAVLSSIKSKILIATTPNIGCNGYPIRKPKQVKKMAHVLHAVGSLGTYKKNSLDYYDVVFLSAPFIRSEVQKLEMLRNLPKKKCIEIGLPYFDVLKNKANPNVSTKDTKTILIAPSWGVKNLFKVCGLEFIGQIIENGFEVIIRPHPQSWISDLDTMEAIIELSRKHPSISLDREVNGLHSFQRADLLISEKSGVRFDFALLFEKPVLSIDIPLGETEGLELSDLGSTWDEQAEKRIGRVISPSQVSEISNHINETLSVSAHSLKVLREEAVFNVGHSSERIVDWVLSEIRELS